MRLYVIIALISLFTFGMGSIFGMRIAQPAYQPVSVGYPTGEQVLVALNEYRISQGLPSFELSERLCNNIHERWKVYREKSSHEGLDEFVAREMPGSQVGEIMVAGDSAKMMVDTWSHSPSHDVLIRKYSKICVYSALGSSVALLSN